MLAAACLVAAVALGSGGGALALVANQPPQLATNATPQFVSLPASVADTAHLSGVTPDAAGTIVFHLYTDVLCTREAPGSPVLVTVHGPGDYLSPSMLIVAPGTYSWVAVYSGDPNNAPSAGLCADPSEILLPIEPPHPALDTTAPPAVAGVPALLTDTARLTGTLANATGTITFHLYSDSACGTEMPGSPTTATIVGNGFYSSPAVPVTAFGTYFWRVSYSGDANNFPVGLSSCGEVGESTIVSPATLEICMADDNGAGETEFSFTATNPKTGQTVGPLIVTGGNCSGPFQADPGRWKLAEDVASGAWRLAAVAAHPQSAYLAETDAKGVARIKVAKGDTVRVTFTDKPRRPA